MTSNTPKSNRRLISGEVERRKSKAEAYMRNPEKADVLLGDAVKKAGGQQDHKGYLTDIWIGFHDLLRLFRAYIRKEYTAIPWGSIVVAVVAIIYFVSPFDLIPDFIPAAGFIDDAAVIAFVLAQLRSDLDSFHVWEREAKLQDLMIGLEGEDKRSQS